MGELIMHNEVRHEIRIGGAFYDDAGKGNSVPFRKRAD